MPGSRRVGLAATIAGATVTTVVLPFTAQAAPTVLYVDNTAGCSDQGTGTQARPYCTVQAAADVAEPGQTVDIATGHGYTGQVTVRRSGEPGRPIVFRGVTVISLPRTSVGTRSWTSAQTPAPHAFLLDGVHDVTLTGLILAAPQEAVLVKDSARIVLDRTEADGGNPVHNGVRAYPDATPAVRITGSSADVTVRRSRIPGPKVAGIAVDAGVTGAVITTNQITNSAGRGVLVTDAPGTVVVSNTFTRNCGTDLELAGNSAGAVVANNILTKRPAPACAGGPSTATPLVVSADSTQGTRTDHNTVVPLNSPGYSWGGTSYPTPEAFRATGQGAHDNATDPKLALDIGFYAPLAAEGITDAADPTAPGTLDTDIRDYAPTDHPGIADTAPSGHRDRGAAELVDQLSAHLNGTPYSQADHPLNARFTVGYNAGWAPGSGSLDFGDGSAPLAVTPETRSVDHDYPAAGTYTATLTATSRTGLVRTSISQVTLAPVADLRTEVWAASGDTSRAGATVGVRSTSPWPIVRHVVDFGDGTAPSVVEGANAEPRLPHEYGVGGTYTITATVTDDHGRTASTSSASSVRGPQAGLPFTGYFGGPSTHNGLFDNGRWLLSYYQSDSTPSTVWRFGDPGDLPVVGNWDNTCRCQRGIYRPGTSTFALQHGNGSVSTVPFGDPGDIPVVGAWDGPRTRNDQLAIYRPGSGLLAVRHDDGSVTSLRFGDPGDIPVVGDWDGVKHAQFGLFRPGRNAGDPNLFILRHDDGTVSAAAYGEKGDLPVVGDWLAKGRTTYGIYRPSTHRFALSNAYAGRPDTAYTIYNY
ncbi:PKD domain-containing protein [Kitasatospora sp. NPDC056327]|uniref:PKD domain-containing protein n=1 Tax=Kitasatospora sp. NPDC056327 TaxID=3345785 RepID=UPI0035DF60B6